MHGLDVSTWTYQFSDTLVCRSARCNDLPCYLPSCYRSHTTYFKRGAGAVRVIDRWEQFQEMPSPKPTTQPPFICFLFLKKEELCTLCPGMSNMARLTCRGGTSCSLQGQGWGLMTVCEANQSLSSPWRRVVPLPHLIFTLPLPVSDDCQLIQLEITLNQKKDTASLIISLVHWLHVCNRGSENAQSWAARPTSCYETTRELKFRRGQKASFSGLLWMNLIQLCGWSQVFL